MTKNGKMAAAPINRRNFETLEEAKAFAKRWLKRKKIIEDFYGYGHDYDALFGGYTITKLVTTEEVIENVQADFQWVENNKKKSSLL